MSNVNIRRAVENIKSGINIYTPLVEVIVNAIQAIDDKAIDNGRVTVTVNRSGQMSLESTVLPEIVGFKVVDNGIGFTEKHRTSFDTLYSAQKIDIGGKGFGRFTVLKYYEDLVISSNFIDGDTKLNRSFKMGKKNDIIVNEVITPKEFDYTGTLVELRSIKRSKFTDKKLTTIARTLFEKLLAYFCSNEYTCPEVLLIDGHDGRKIILNDFLKKEGKNSIIELPKFNQEFVLKDNIAEQHHFQARVFKFYSPKQQKAKLILSHISV